MEKREYDELRDSFLEDWEKIYHNPETYDFFERRALYEKNRESKLLSLEIGGSVKNFFGDKFIGVAEKKRLQEKVLTQIIPQSLVKTDKSNSYQRILKLSGLESYLADFSAKDNVLYDKSIFPIVYAYKRISTFEGVGEHKKNRYHKQIIKKDDKHYVNNVLQDNPMLIAEKLKETEDFDYFKLL